MGGFKDMPPDYLRHLASAKGISEVSVRFQDCDILRWTKSSMSSYPALWSECRAVIGFTKLMSAAALHWHRSNRVELVPLPPSRPRTNATNATWLVAKTWWWDTGHKPDKPDKPNELFNKPDPKGPKVCSHLFT